MSRAQRPSVLSGRFTRGLGSAWLFVRWMLVLVLAFDQASAPFHHHHHEGAGAQFDWVASHGLSNEARIHVDSDDSLVGSHSAMAIRVDPSRGGQVQGLDPTDAVVAVCTGLQWLAVLDAPAPLQGGPAPAPDFHSHRSLPPAGRAPPLHA